MTKRSDAAKGWVIGIVKSHNDGTLFTREMVAKLRHVGDDPEAHYYADMEIVYEVADIIETLIESVEV